jgi:hypothetical protein
MCVNEKKIFYPDIYINDSNFFFFFFLLLKKEFVRGSPRSVLLAFSQFYIEYDLRKNKIVVPFFC